MLNILLVAVSEKLAEAWREAFAGQQNVTVIEGDITKVKCDAVVSPADSFGFMDGGLDYALSDRFGWGLEKRLQQKIRELPEAELLVGQAMVIDTNDDAIPYLISAPTMRVPTNFNIDTSVNAYLAMKSILIKAEAHDKISTVAIPGLCTGVGRMQPIIAARQMLVAYKEIILKHRMDFRTFGKAQKYHWNINPQGMIWTH